MVRSFAIAVIGSFAVAAQAGYVAKTSGTCATPITSAAECSKAAAALRLSDRSVSDDRQNGVSYDPKGCYYEGNSLKYNSRNTNRGTCSVYDKCLCKTNTPVAWPKMTYQHCAGTKASYSAYYSKASAQAACALNSKCSGIYDSACDARGAWYQCTYSKYAVSGSSCIYKKTPTAVTPTPAPAPTKYTLQVQGKCRYPITSAAACAAAATELKLNDKTVMDDGQHGGVTYDPNGCYFEGNSLKYNSKHKNTGFCTNYDQCLCAKTMQATRYPTRAPTRYPTNYPTRFPTRYPTRAPTRYPTPAPINCKIGAWQTWSTCNKKCGGGSQRRYRPNQSARYGGKACPHAFETQRCNAQPCPIDGGFGMWSAWGSCDKSCDGGVSTQTRACNRPAPAFGGKKCVGAAKNTKVCNTNVCNCPTCKIVKGHIAVGHVTEHAKTTHGPRTVHKDCQFKAGGCSSTVVIAHTCKASKGVCACTCKKPTALQRRDHHVITQLPNKFDLVNNVPKNAPHTEWPKISNMHCAGTKADGNTYKSRADAAAACRLNAKCSGIYDSSCDATGSWYICTKNAYMASGMGSCIYKMPPTNFAPTPAPAPKPYVLQESGTCASLITTKADCEEAAAVLGLSDKTVTDDGQHGGVVYDPKGCYFEQGSLKYNTYHKNTGGCNSIDKCLCRVPMASTRMLGEEGRPVIKK